MKEEKTCKQRVKSELKQEVKILNKLWENYCNDPDYGNFFEYGLCFDYVPQATFTDQNQGYFRYQISWGGPSSEFRFYVNPDFSCYKIEFWFLNWGDGACIDLQDFDYKLLLEIYEFFNEIGLVRAEFNKSQEN